MQQKTIVSPVSYEGLALFSGVKTKIILRPAGVNTGIVFIRIDDGDKRINVSSDVITTNYRRTGLAQNGVSVETTEHLLSAIYGLGIDNLEIAINGSEVPHTDGSAKDFVDLISSVGIKEQDLPKKTIKLKFPVTYAEGDISLIALPDDGLTIDYTLQYDSPLIGTQHKTIKLDESTYKNELASARTFCLASEVEHFQKQGLGKGANYNNILVVDKDKVVQNKLRFPDEFVRHKMLDLLGDLALLGAPLEAKIIAIKSGHDQNVKFVRKIKESLSAGATAQPKQKVWLESRELQNILPHRYPFLLIDRVIEMEGYNRAVGIKNVTINEEFFNGHFPGRPLMPGVLQVEAMAQLIGALLLSRTGNENKLAVFLSIDEAKFRRPVVPGDQLRIEVETTRDKGRIIQAMGKIMVDGEVACESQFKFMLVDKE
ncbi:MAG: UDP-3-O-acyl-N-acetylglucosamine deacetylase [Candidatus Brocadiia bacterium]